MLRRTSGLSGPSGVFGLFGLPRPVVRWVSQVTASLGATLSATLIWSAVPHPGAAPAARPGAQAASQPAAPPELTSGGKFAARAERPVAYDGLDTMPLPRVAPAPPRLVLASAEVGAPRMLQRAASDEPPAAERRAARPARPQVRAEIRAEARRPEPNPTVAAATSTPSPSVAVPPEAPQGEGLLDRVLPASVRSALGSSLPSALPSLLPEVASTARDAWAATASAGGAIVDHVIPRLPRMP